MSETSHDRIKAKLNEAKVLGPVFGLRAFPGDNFRISPEFFKHFESEGEIQLVVEVQRDDKWLDMGRNTLDHILGEAVVRVSPVKKVDRDLPESNVLYLDPYEAHILWLAIRQYIALQQVELEVTHENNPDHSGIDEMTQRAKELAGRIDNLPTLKG